MYDDIKGRPPAWQKKPFSLLHAALFISLFNILADDE